jgi:hypothetical protein
VRCLPLELGLCYWENAHVVDFYALYRGRDRGLYWVEKGGYNGIAVARRFVSVL